MQVGRQFIDFFNNKSTKKKRIPRYKDTDGYNIITFPKAVISKQVDFDNRVEELNEACTKTARVICGMPT